MASSTAQVATLVTQTTISLDNVSPVLNTVLVANACLKDASPLVVLHVTLDTSPTLPNQVTMNAFRRGADC